MYYLLEALTTGQYLVTFMRVIAGDVYAFVAVDVYAVIACDVYALADCDVYTPPD